MEQAIDCHAGDGICTKISIEQLPIAAKHFNALAQLIHPHLLHAFEIQPHELTTFTEDELKFLIEDCDATFPQFEESLENTVRFNLIYLVFSWLHMLQNRDDGCRHPAELFGRFSV